MQLKIRITGVGPVTVLALPTTSKRRWAPIRCGTSRTISDVHQLLEEQGLRIRYDGGLCRVQLALPLSISGDYYSLDELLTAVYPAPRRTGE